MPDVTLPCHAPRSPLSHVPSSKLASQTHTMNLNLSFSSLPACHTCRPLLALPAGVFSLGYFKMWIIIALTWGFAATAVCLILPW